MRVYQLVPGLKTNLSSNRTASGLTRDSNTTKVCVRARSVFVISLSLPFPLQNVKEIICSFGLFLLPKGLGSRKQANI